MGWVGLDGWDGWICASWSGLSCLVPCVTHSGWMSPYGTYDRWFTTNFLPFPVSTRFFPHWERDWNVECLDKWILSFAHRQGHGYNWRNIPADPSGSRSSAGNFHLPQLGGKTRIIATTTTGIFGRIRPQKRLKKHKSLRVRTRASAPSQERSDLLHAPTAKGKNEAFVSVNTL